MVDATINFPLGRKITRDVEITGELWKYGNVIACSNGTQISYSVYFALCDDKPWWCPRWLMEKIKKRIVKISIQDMKVSVSDSQGA